MTDLPAVTYHNLRSVLLRCGPFDDDHELKAVFVDGRISLWRSELPEATNTAKRVNLTIFYLLERYNTNGQNALVLLLKVLSDQKTCDDSCYGDLLALVKEMEALCDEQRTSEELHSHDEGFRYRTKRLWDEALEKAHDDFDSLKWGTIFKPFIIPLILLTGLAFVVWFLANLGATFNFARDYVWPDTATPTATVTPTPIPTPFPTPTPLPTVSTQEGYGYWLAISEWALSLLSRYWIIILLFIIFPIVVLVFQLNNLRKKNLKERQRFGMAVAERLKKRGVVCEFCFPAWLGNWKRSRVSSALKAYARQHPREVEIGDYRLQRFRDHFLFYHPQMPLKFVVRHPTVLARSKGHSTVNGSESIDLSKLLEDVDPLLITTMLILFFCAIMIYILAFL
jgi:hypothetical protein